MKVGDIVARRSYGCDVFFKVSDIAGNGTEKMITLKGISYRIEADAPESDLELQPENKVAEYRNKCCRLAERNNSEYTISRYRGYQKKARYRDTSNDKAGFIRKPGKVLHLDGDEEYLENCLNEYKRLGIITTGQFVAEREQPMRVFGLLQEHRPDILVLTGHDGLIRNNDNYGDIGSYRNSRYFIEAVKEARRFNNDMDGLVIFAGACQSLYSEIMRAGANFASAPFRVLIHELDPVRVCEKVAFTSINQVLEAENVIDNTITGKTGIGGMQTRGKYREGFPAEPYQQLF